MGVELRFKVLLSEAKQWLRLPRQVIGTGSWNPFTGWLYLHLDIMPAHI